MDVPLIPISAAVLIAKTSTCSRQEGVEEWGLGVRVGASEGRETLKNRGEKWRKRCAWVCKNHGRGREKEEDEQ